MVKTFLSTTLSYDNIKDIVFTPFQTEEIETKYTVESLIVINLYILFKHQVNMSQIINILVLINRYFIEQLKIHTPIEDFDPENVVKQAPKTIGEFAWYFIKLISVNYHSLFVSSKPENHRLVFTIMKTLIKNYKYIPKSLLFLDEIFGLINNMIENG